MNLDDSDFSAAQYFEHIRRRKDLSHLWDIMDAKPLLVFDGDDTLWKTMPIYTEAKQTFFRLMEREGFSRIKVERFFNNRDRQNVRTLGFSKRRFGLSMQQTYRHFSHEIDRRSMKTVKTEIDAIRDRVFKKQPQLVPFARTVLQSLAHTNRLILLTKGTRKIQLYRVSTSGLSHFFEKIVVVRQKSRRTFSSIVQDLKVSPSNAWSIGDSIRSDINPALQSGLNAIWIPQTTWDYERGVAHRTKRFYKVQSLKNVAATVKSFSSD
jgi:putative hydrolase of the HAD superfamily